MRKLDPVWAQVQRPLQVNGQIKKMKKRKELDALLGNRGRSSYEQFHRIDGDLMVSSSSREADIYFQHPSKHFSMLHKRAGQSITSKHGSCTSKRLFCLCLPICILALVAACVTSSIGIVWMQMQLKADMEFIKDRILKLERWKVDEPASLTDVQASLASLMHDVMDLKEGNSGVRAANAKIALLVDQMEALPKVQQLVSKEDVDKLKKRLSDMRRTIHQTSSAVAQTADKYLIMSATVDELRTKTQSMEDAVQELTSRSHHDSSSVEDSINSTLSRMDRLAANVSSVNATVCAIQDRSRRMLSRLEKMETRLSILPEEKIDEKMLENLKDSPLIEKVIGVKTNRFGGSSHLEAGLPTGGGNIASSPDKTSHRVGDTTVSFTQSSVRRPDAS